MKRVDFIADAEPLIGSSVEVIGTVTHDGTMPRVLNVRYNRHPIALPVTGGTVRITVAFPTPSTVTIAPPDGYEGDTLVLEAVSEA